MIINPGMGSKEFITFLRDTTSQASIIGFEIPLPSNFHAHLRKEDLMRAIGKHIMALIFYLVVMPNTGPVRSIGQMMDYFYELMDYAAKHGCGQVQLIMTIYYTDDVTPKFVERLAAVARMLGIRVAVKFYPTEHGTTTGSGHGKSILHAGDEILAMADHDVPALIHAESIADKSGRPLGLLDGEAYYVDEFLRPFRDRFKTVKVCLEHMTTKNSVDFVKSDSSGLTFGTTTPHGSFCTVHDTRDKSWGVLLHSKTYAQKKPHVEAVAEFTVSGDFRVIAGDDTAAHLSRTKIKPLEKAAFGAFWTSRHSLARSAQLFHERGALDDRFVMYHCFNGPDRWGMKRPDLDHRIRFRVATEDDDLRPILVPEADDVVLPLGWSTAPDRLQLQFACEAVTP